MHYKGDSCAVRETSQRPGGDDADEAHEDAD